MYKDNPIVIDKILHSINRNVDDTHYLDSDRLSKQSEETKHHNLEAKLHNHKIDIQQSKALQRQMILQNQSIRKKLEQVNIMNQKVILDNKDNKRILQLDKQILNLRRLKKKDNNKIPVQLKILQDQNTKLKVAAKQLLLQKQLNKHNNHKPIRRLPDTNYKTKQNQHKHQQSILRVDNSCFSDEIKNKQHNNQQPTINSMLNLLSNPQYKSILLHLIQINQSKTK